MLRKRLIWKIIEDNNYNAITVNAMAAELKALIKREICFQMIWMNRKMPGLQ